MGRRFTIFALFYFVFEGKFQVHAHPGGGGRVFGGLVFGGGYTWRGIFSEFYGKRKKKLCVHLLHVEIVLKTKQPEAETSLVYDVFIRVIRKESAS